MAKYTGYIDTDEERIRGTPSVDIPSASLLSLDKNCPSADTLLTLLHPKHLS